MLRKCRFVASCCSKKDIANFSRLCIAIYYNRNNNCRSTWPRFVLTERLLRSQRVTYFYKAGCCTIPQWGSLWCCVARHCRHHPHIPSRSYFANLYIPYQSCSGNSLSTFQTFMYMKVNCSCIIYIFLYCFIQSIYLLVFSVDKTCYLPLQVTNI